MGAGTGTGQGRRAPVALAAALWALSLALATAAAILQARTLGAPFEPTFGSRRGMLLGVLAMAVAAAVGALVASRRPRHPVGWLLLVAACVGLAFQVADGYAVLALSDPAAGLPGASAVAWLANWLWVVTWGVAAPLLFLIFPDGRLPSRRWRPLAGLVVGVGLLVAAALALSPGPLDAYPRVGNPLGAGGTAGALLARATPALVALLRALTALAGASLLVRLYRARGVERQQIKWVAYASVMTAAIAAASEVVSRSGRILWVEDLSVVVSVTISLAAGFAVLRYRLYAIDRLASRTISYALLTAVLAAVYLVAVLASSRALAPVGARGDLPVAAATLAAAAAFRPARRRIQALVDRRFNRARYDAEQVIAAFRRQLRAEVGLPGVTGATGSAVAATVAPVRASLWLRDGPAGPATARAGDATVPVAPAVTIPGRTHGRGGA